MPDARREMIERLPIHMTREVAATLAIGFVLMGFVAGLAFMTALEVFGA